MPAKKTPTKQTKTAPVKDTATTPLVEDNAVENQPAERRKFDKEDRIPCRSVTVGELICASPKNKEYTYRWSNYGDYCEVEYQDLLALNSRRSGFIYNPAFIIEDDQLIEDWKLDSIYATFYGFDEPNAFFRLPPAEIKSRLQEAPQGLKDAIKSVAAQCVKNGTLDSINAIRAVDAALGTQLLEFAR